jgi:hypothetical protein
VARAGPEARRRYVAALTKGALAAEQVDRLCAATVGGLGALRQAWESRGRAWEPWGAGPAGSPPVAVERIVVAVARETGVAAGAIAGRRRTAGVLWARSAFLLAARRLGASLGEAAAALDGRRVAALARFEASARRAAGADPALAAAVDRVVERLRAERAAT